MGNATLKQLITEPIKDLLEMLDDENNNNLKNKS